MDHYVIDFYRMFFGTGFSWPLAFEIIFRTSFLYFYSLVNIRLAGKQGLSQLTPFQFIIVVALGTAIGDPMFYQNVPLLHGMVVITSVILLEKFTLMLISKNETLNKILEGTPTLIIKDGQVIEDELARQGISLPELLEMLRLHGIKDTGQVEYAFMEPSGNLSVIPHERSRRSVYSTVDLLHKEFEKRI